MRFNPIRAATAYYGEAYIAGEGLGIVSINGRAAAREVLCLDNDTKEVLYKTWSHADGSYLIPGLDSCMWSSPLITRATTSLWLTTASRRIFGSLKTPNLRRIFGSLKTHLRASYVRQQPVIA